MYLKRIGMRFHLFTRCGYLTPLDPSADTLETSQMITKRRLINNIFKKKEILIIRDLGNIFCRVAVLSSFFFFFFMLMMISSFSLIWFSFSIFLCVLLHHLLVQWRQPTSPFLSFSIYSATIDLNWCGRGGRAWGYTETCQNAWAYRLSFKFISSFFLWWWIWFRLSSQ